MNPIALLMVDVQNDFVIGSLAVPRGDEVARGISEYMRTHDRLKIASKDMHIDPGEHFITYPPHCVQGTSGAAYYHRFAGNYVDVMVEKGAYSGATSAFDGVTRDGRTLQAVLQDAGVTEVEVCGLAADVCVLSTCMDSLANGYRTTMLVGLTAAIGGDEGMADAVLGVLNNEGFVR